MYIFNSYSPELLGYISSSWKPCAFKLVLTRGGMGTGWSTLSWRLMSVSRQNRIQSWAFETRLEYPLKDPSLSRRGTGSLRRQFSHDLANLHEGETHTIPRRHPELSAIDIAPVGRVLQKGVVQQIVRDVRPVNLPPTDPLE